MAGSVGVIFAEIDLDNSRYLKSQKKLYQDATQTTLNIEANFKKLGVRSSAEMDLMRQKITNSYNMIANSSKATANDILRAEKAKNAQLKRLNEEQYGAHQSMLSRMRSHWMAYSVAVYAGMRALRATRNEFRDFETALVDMGKVTDRSLDLIRKDIMAINPVLGDATSLMKGYYQTISAGVTDPVKALDLLTTAAKAAKAAHVDQSEVIKALTKMMAGFEGQIRSTEEAADLLFATEKLGQTTVQELVPIIGDISKASKEAGVNQFEMAAALALSTQPAGRTSDAATQYKSILMGLLRPNEELTKLIEGQGYASSIAMVQQLGFADALQAIRKQADLTGTQIGKLFRSSEGMLGLASLSADSFRTYKQRIEDVGAGAGSAKKAFDEWKESAEAIDSELGSNFKNTMIEIGTTFAPVWNDAINALSASFRGLASAIQAARERAQELRNTLPSDTLDLFSILGGVDTGLRGIEDSGAFRKKIKFGPGSLPPPSVTPTPTPGGGGTAGGYAGYVPFLPIPGPSELLAMDESLTKEFERIEQERLRIVADFNSQYADLGKSQFELERDRINEQAELWKLAGADQVQVAEWASEKLKAISEDEFSVVTEFGVQAAHNIQDAFSDFFYDAFTGELDTARDYFKAFTETITRAWSNMLSKMLMESMQTESLMKGIKGIGGFLSGLFGGGSMAGSYAGPASLATAGNVGFTGLWHSGGVVGRDSPAGFRETNSSMFYNAPRLHSGLMPDEFPAILQRGETVIPKGKQETQQKETVNYNIVIQAVDAKSFSDLTKRNPQAIIGPIVSAINDNNSSMRTSIRTAMGK